MSDEPEPRPDYNTIGVHKGWTIWIRLYATDTVPVRARISRPIPSGGPPPAYQPEVFEGQTEDEAVEKARARIDHIITEDDD